MAKRDKVIYASQGGPRVNGKLIYRIICSNCGKQMDLVGTEWKCEHCDTTYNWDKVEELNRG